MQPDLDKVSFIIGNVDNVRTLPKLAALKPFSERIINFLDDVSKKLMSSSAAKDYSDVIAFAFWIRRGSVSKLKDKYGKKDGLYRLGKGVAFHIAPSNVPVNFAYSLAVGLLAGNANIVRVPSKDYEQVSIIADAFGSMIDNYDDLRPYVNLVKYARDKEINDYFSFISDVRIIWGGDATISEIRKSPLPPRSGDITFADRYSLAVIDSDTYLEIEDKFRVAENFYNDTFLFDQNACTSPSVVVWIGNSIEKAKTIFWEYENKLVEKKYNLQPIQAVNKLTSAFLLGEAIRGCRVIEHDDNLIIRIRVPEVTPKLMDYKDSGGFFFEYDCKNIMEIGLLCNDKHCQTIGYIGNKEIFAPLIKSGNRGIDRIVPIGKTMNFDLIWDGYNLLSQMTRIIITE